MAFTMLPMATETSYCDSLVYFLVFCKERNPWQSFSQSDSDMLCKVKCCNMLTADVCLIFKKIKKAQNLSFVDEIK